MSQADAPAFTPWDNPMGTDGFEFIEYAAPDPVAMGKVFERMGFTAKTKIDRKDFGAKWNAALEAGGFVVGDMVDITIEVEAMKKKG